jgi:hypothetical protein
MSAITPQELLNLWTREQLSTERATGQILQHLTTMHAALEALRLKMSTLQAQLESLTIPTETATPKAKKSPPSRQ